MRCLFKITATLLGLVCLGLGAYTLYTVHLDEPDARMAVLGGASRTASEVDATDILPITVEGEPSDAVLFGQPSIDPMTLSVQPSDAPPPAVDTDEVSPDRIRSQADDAISAESLGNTTLQANPVLQNQPIDSDSSVEIVTIATTGDETLPETDGQGGAAVTTGENYEQRVVELEWPDKFREGESGAVRVTLRALEDGGVQAEAEIEGNTVLATPILIIDRYETHDARVTARISAPDFEVTSPNNQIVNMLPGQEVSWRWVLTPSETGRFIITFGIELTWAPKDPNAGLRTYGPIPIWGQAVQTQVDQVFGLISIPEASIAGTILAVIGALAEIPFVIELVGNIFERRRKRHRNA